MTIGERIIRMRDQKGWSQNQLAAFAGLSRPTVEQLEQNPNYSPKLDTLQAVAKALGVHVAVIIGADEYEDPLVREVADFMSQLTPEKKRTVCDVARMALFPGGMKLAIS